MRAFKTQFLLSAGTLVVLSIFSVSSANAVLMYQSISNLEFLDEFYDVELWQDTDGNTSFDQVYGSYTMTADLTFTDSSTAYAAAQVLTDYALTYSFDLSPYSKGNLFPNAAVVPYVADSQFDYVVAYPSRGSTPTGPWQNAERTNTSFIGSFAKFSPHNANQIPAPNSVWLFVLGLLGIAYIRRDLLSTHNKAGHTAVFGGWTRQSVARLCRLR